MTCSVAKITRKVAMKYEIPKCEVTTAAVEIGFAGSDEDSDSTGGKTPEYGYGDDNWD